MFSTSNVERYSFKNFTGEYDATRSVEATSTAIASTYVQATVVAINTKRAHAHILSEPQTPKLFGVALRDAHATMQLAI